MPWVTDVLAGLQMAIDSFWYGILMLLAQFHWGVMKPFFLMGHVVQVINQWLTAAAFAPLVQYTGESLRLATSAAFVIALMVLGCTYMLAAIVRLDVVSPRNAILWYIAGLLFFQMGPALYRGMNDFRQTIGSVFYLSVLQTLQGATDPAFASLSGVTSAELGILTPCDNFGPYLGRPGGHGASIIVNGLDVALAYVRADGIDVMGYPYPMSDNCQGHPPVGHPPGSPPSYVHPLPWEWYRPGSFFDEMRGPFFFPDMTPEERAASIALAGGAQGRLLTAWPLALFGVAEQIVGLCLTIAQGLTFISFSCAILFAFFKRTEVIAWAVVDQWVELLVQTVVIAMLQALVVSFFLAGAATANGLVVLAVGLLCLVFMLILLRSGLRAIWRAFNRLFDAMGRATGGIMLSPGGTVRGMAHAATGVAGAVAGGAAAMTGGTLALMSGASWAQAAGVTLGGSNSLAGAATVLSRLPGLRETALGDVASHFAEGAAVRRAGGSVVGAALLTDRAPAPAKRERVVDEDGLPLDGEITRRSAPPMLIPAVGNSLEWMTTAPLRRRPRTGASEADDSEAEAQESVFERLGFTPLHPTRMGQFTPIRPFRADETDLDEVIGADARRTAQATVGSAPLRADQTDLDEVLAGDMRQAATGAARDDEATTGGRMQSAAAGLEQTVERVGEALSRAAEGLERAGRQQMLEGRLTVSGPANVASLVGDAVSLVQARRAAEGGARLEGVDHLLAGRAVAAAMGVTPIEGGKPPVEGDLARVGLVIDQALRLGLDGVQVARAAREVRESPDARLTPATRDELTQRVRVNLDIDHEGAARAVSALEQHARLLPNAITTYGRVRIPSEPAHSADEQGEAT